jgi:hypothetical protein
MADLGDLLGSLMTGLIRARRMADEQTAALAEYYKSNPLLEGLSVPRIRIPELTIEMPLLIENHVEGESGEMEDPSKIADIVGAQMKETLLKNNIKTSPAFNKIFLDKVKDQLAIIKQSGAPVMKETVTRGVQTAFADALNRTTTKMDESQKEIISKNIRAKISTVRIAKAPVIPSVVANIKTADIKEQASDASVVRLKITLNEEGMEWTTQAGEAGGVVRTLQPE